MPNDAREAAAALLAAYDRSDIPTHYHSHAPFCDAVRDFRAAIAAIETAKPAGEVVAWRFDDALHGREPVFTDTPRVARAWEAAHGTITPLYAALAASPVPSEWNAAIAEIATERQRQIDAEGWTAEHDDAHDGGELASAASCYAAHAGDRQGWDPIDYQQAEPLFTDDDAGMYPWPWDIKWWKPTTPRRDLIKAGALIVAEIERLDRLTRPEPAQDAGVAIGAYVLIKRGLYWRPDSAGYTSDIRFAGIYSEAESAGRLSEDVTREALTIAQVNGIRALAHREPTNG